MEEGQPFTTADVDAAAKVALIGKTVAGSLFNGEDPVGRVIRIKKVPVHCGGDSGPPTGQDQDDVILLPISSAKKKVIGGSQANAASVGQIMVQAHDGMTAAVLKPMTDILRQRHHIHSRYDRSVQGSEKLGERDVDSAGG